MIAKPNPFHEIHPELHADRHTLSGVYNYGDAAIRFKPQDVHLSFDSKHHFSRDEETKAKP